MGSAASPEVCKQDYGDESQHVGQHGVVPMGNLDVTHGPTTRQFLNVMHEGIRSLLELDFSARGVSPSALLSLSLHSNRVSSLEGLSSMTSLTTLNLSSNELDGVAIRSSGAHLGVLVSLETLDLSCNRIDALLGLPFLPRLRRLLVPYNRLTSLDGIQALASSLTHLDARDNRLVRPVDAHIAHLSPLFRLESLLLMSPGGHQASPVCRCPRYREEVFCAMRSLTTLDGEPESVSNVAPTAPTAPGETDDDLPRPTLTRRDGNGQARAGFQDDRVSPRAAIAAREPATARRLTASRTVGSASWGVSRDGERDGRLVVGFMDRNGEAVGDGDNIVEETPVLLEDVLPMPRFEAVAGRFQERHGGHESLQSGQPSSRFDAKGRLGTAISSAMMDRADGGVGGPPASVKRPSPTENDAWNQGCRTYGDANVAHGRRQDSATEAHAVCEGTAENASPSNDRRRCVELPGGRDGGTDEDFSGVERAGEPEDAGGEQGLLSRLSSVAYEARLELMDSRLQEIHERQRMGVAEARRATVKTWNKATGETEGRGEPARHVAGKLGSSTTPGPRSETRAVVYSRGGHQHNPWAPVHSGAPRKVGVTSAVARHRPPANPDLSEPCRAPIGGVESNSRSRLPSRRPQRSPSITEGIASPLEAGSETSEVVEIYGQENDARFPCRVVPRTSPPLPTGPSDRRWDRESSGPSIAPPLSSPSDRSGLRVVKPSAARKMEGACKAPRDGDGASGGADKISSVDASTQASLGPRTTGPASPAPFRSLASRSRRIGIAGGSAAAGGWKDIAAMMRAAGVAGAGIAMARAFEKNRVASGFLRWAKKVEMVKARAGAAMADRALAQARREAEQEKALWESKYEALESATRQRERDVREAAEEAARERVESCGAVQREAETAAKVLRERVASMEEELAALSLREQEAVQVVREQSRKEISRVAGEADAEMARMRGRLERLEEQLKGNAKAAEDAEEESRRLRAQLREAESRCRGSEDQLEEARAREKRSSGDAQEALRRSAIDADGKLARAVNEERARMAGVLVRLEEAEALARRAAVAGQEAASGEARSRQAACELAEVVRQQKAALLQTRREVDAAHAARAKASEATATVSARLTSMVSEIQQLREDLRARDEEIAGSRRTHRQHAEALAAGDVRVKELEATRKDLEARLDATAGGQEDLRMALMVKDKVLEDRMKLITELQEREEDALAEARAWRDRLEATQSEADEQMEAAREEISELQTQVVTLSGADEQLRDVFHELRRYRGRHGDGKVDRSPPKGQGFVENEDLEKGGEEGRGVSSPKTGDLQDLQDLQPEDGDRSELTAVAAITLAAKAVEEELQNQLATKDQALRYVEDELLNMKSMFDGKEASLRRELGEQREKLEREASEQRKQAQEALAAKLAAEEAALQERSARDDLRTSLHAKELRSRELEGALRALVFKYEEEKHHTSQKVAAMASLFQQLQGPVDEANT